VLIYSFSVHNAAGGDRETVGRMALAHDKAARAFGKAVIGDMMRSDDPRYAGWTMDVAKGLFDAGLCLAEDARHRNRCCSKRPYAASTDPSWLSCAARLERACHSIAISTHAILMAGLVASRENCSLANALSRYLLAILFIPRVAGISKLADTGNVRDPDSTKQLSFFCLLSPLTPEICIFEVGGGDSPRSSGESFSLSNVTTTLVPLIQTPLQRRNAGFPPPAAAFKNPLLF
jgi:hypothetical protein